MRVTRETLAQENINLGLELAKFKNFELALRENDSKRRKEFAKAFGWSEDGYGYTVDKVYKTPSWEEIFTKIGKLLVYEGMNESSKEMNQLKEVVYKLGEELENHLKV